MIFNLCKFWGFFFFFFFLLHVCSLKIYTIGFKSINPAGFHFAKSITRLHLGYPNDTSLPIQVTTLIVTLSLTELTEYLNFIRLSGLYNLVICSPDCHIYLSILYFMLIILMISGISALGEEPRFWISHDFIKKTFSHECCNLITIKRFNLMTFSAIQSKEHSSFKLHFKPKFLAFVS